MPYGTYDRHTHIFQDDSDGIDDIHQLEVAASSPSDLFDVVDPITVTRVGIIATVAFNYDTLSTVGVVTFYRLTTYGDTGTRVAFGTITLTDGIAIGQVIKRDINPVDLNVGDQIEMVITTQAVGGTEVGDWKSFVCFHQRAEVTANQLQQQDTV